LTLTLVLGVDALDISDDAELIAELTSDDAELITELISDDALEAMVLD